MREPVRASTLKAGQLIQTTKGRIYVLIEMLNTRSGLVIEVAECGKKKIDTVRDEIDPNAMVTPVEADFFAGDECVHRTYKEDEDGEEMVAMPDDRSMGTPQKIRKCLDCKRALPPDPLISRCKACVRNSKRKAKQRNRKAPGVKPWKTG